jgi:type IV secretory pathway protease TraF
MVRLRLTPRRRANLLVTLGAVLASVGAGLIFLPAGLLVAGASSAAAGLYLVDVEGAREPGPARPPHPTL